MSQYIPLDMQAEILKRLPLKPLIQFRLVSKPWKRLIDSPDFIVSYGVRHPQPDRFILRYELAYLHHSDDIYLTLADKYITLVDNGDSFVQQEFIPKVPDLYEKLQPYLKFIVGSSHGLLCFKVHPFKGQSMVVLWNPSIRKSIGIKVPDMYDSNNKISSYIYNVFGFGVCPATLDPTILNIKCIDYNRKMEDMPVISVHWKVGVFTLSTGAWSILSTNLPRESIRLREDQQVVIDRFIYWVAFDKLGAEDGQSQLYHLIVSFDLTTKGFKEINLPECLSNRSCRILGISKLRMSLVVLAEVDVSVCSLWMMKEERFNRSFTKLYNINYPNLKVNQILGFRKARELIIETQQQNAELQIYDPNSEAIDNLGIGGEAYSFFMCSYMETLLLLDQVDGFIYSISPGRINYFRLL